MKLNHIYQGDCLEVMKGFPDNSIDTILTDPPYGLGFMGKEWDTFDRNQFGIKGKEGENDLKVKKNFDILPRYNKGIKAGYNLQYFTYQWAKEALRVAKPGATLMCFGGTRTWHRIAVGIEEAGWEIFDTIMFLYGSGFPKSLNIGKAINKIQKNSKWEGWGTSLKPAYEPIICARKPNEGSYANNALKWGVAGLNINEARIGTEKVNVHDAPKGTFAGGEQNRGSIKNYRDHQGRFPANLILNEEAARELDRQSGIRKSGSMNGVYRNTIMKGQPGVRNGKEIRLRQQASIGGASRFFYCAKASKAERNRGCEELEEKIGGGMAGTADKTLKTGSGNERNNRMKNNHPTVKPLSLMKYLCILTKTPTETGGIILDPFAGSGTTGMACVEVGRPYILIEKEADYVKIAKARIKATVYQPKIL